MSSKLVVVTGATGTQGGAVIRALLNKGGYAIRGLTRNIHSTVAETLASQGVEMVAADLADKQSLVSAFKGAYAVFGNTVFPCDADTETQGRNMVDACKANDVPLFVWSSMPSAKEISNGKYTDVYHWEQKQAVDQYLNSVGQPSVILYLAGFLDNLVTQPYRLVPDEANPNKWILNYALVPPNVKMSSIWIGGDFGPIVAGIIEHWEDDAWRKRLTEKPIPVAGLRASPEDVAAAIKRVSEKDVQAVMTDAPPGFPQPLISMFKLFGDGFYDFAGPNPPDILVELGVKFHTLDDFVQEVILPFMQK